MIINSGWYFHFKFLLLLYNISLVNIFFNFNKFNVSCYCKDAKNVLKLEYGPWVYKYLISTFFSLTFCSCIRKLIPNMQIQSITLASFIWAQLSKKKSLSKIKNELFPREHQRIPRHKTPCIYWKPSKSKQQHWERKDSQIQRLSILKKHLLSLHSLGLHCPYLPLITGSWY